MPWLGLSGRTEQLEELLAVLRKCLGRVLLSLREWLRLESFGEILDIRIATPRVEVDLALVNLLRG